MNLHEHINQSGITYGPKKYEIFLKACRLMEVPAIGASGPDSPYLVKIFDPTGSWTWYVQEYDEETGEAFGLVDGHERESGYFDLKELSEVKGPLGIGLEVDVFFTPKTSEELEEGGTSK